MCDLKRSFRDLLSLASPTEDTVKIHEQQKTMADSTLPPRLPPSASAASNHENHAWNNFHAHYEGYTGVLACSNVCHRPICESTAPCLSLGSFKGPEEVSGVGWVEHRSCKCVQVWQVCDRSQNTNFIECYVVHHVYLELYDLYLLHWHVAISLGVCGPHSLSPFLVCT